VTNLPDHVFDYVPVHVLDPVLDNVLDNPLLGSIPIYSLVGRRL